MSSVWRENIELIQNGESVDQKTPNRPMSQLADRTEYLKQRLDAAASGEGLVMFSQTVATDVAAGDAVYYDTTSQSYKRAKATASEDADSGALSTDPQAYVVGIVTRKLTSTAADIGIQGRFADLELTDSAGTALSEGQYFLSATDAGKLETARPAVGIFVCTVTSQGVLINPTPREVLEDHIHYRFALKPNPAGTAICRGDSNRRVSIEFADSTKEGWLPATDPVFQGNAPAGAYFGYNWSVNPKLAAVFPPQPLSSSYVERNGIGVAPQHVQINQHGIWWMTDCNTDVPWENELCQSSSTAVVERSSSSSNTPDPAYQPCAETNLRVILWFTRMVSQTDQAAVTGLKAADGSPIVVSGCDEKDAGGFCAGKLELDLQLPWNRNRNTTGGEVVKTVSGQGDLGVGFVAEGVKGAGLVTVTGTQTLSGGYSAGLLTITGLDPTQVTRKVSVDVVALDGATESLYQDVLPFVGLPTGRASSFTGKIRIPQIQMTRPRVEIVLWFAVPTQGTPPANVTISYARVEPALPAAESSSSLFGGGFGTLPTSFSSGKDLFLEDLGSLSAGNYFERSSLTLNTVSDELILFRVNRTASDGYAGELAIVNMFAKIYDAG